jgi:SAM-dependent methyltransferase
MSDLWAPPDTMSPDRSIFADDQMYLGNSEHYFLCGKSAIDVLTAALRLTHVTPQAILDYGAGAGRVTRWLKAAFPTARIYACDVRTGEMEFLRATFGVETWTVSPDVEKLEIPHRVDLVWAGSVMTHLSRRDAAVLIGKLLAACNPGGLVAFSFHGPSVLTSGNAGSRYIHEIAWARILLGYYLTGYGYADYRGEKSYGISLCSLGWIVRLARSIPDVQIKMLGELAWDGHHDVVVLQKMPPPPPADPERWRRLFDDLVLSLKLAMPPVIRRALRGRRAPQDRDP